MLVEGARDDRGYGHSDHHPYQFLDHLTANSIFANLIATNKLLANEAIIESLFAENIKATGSIRVGKRYDKDGNVVEDKEDEAGAWLGNSGVLKANKAILDNVEAEGGNFKDINVQEDSVFSGDITVSGTLTSSNYEKSTAGWLFPPSESVGGSAYIDKLNTKEISYKGGNSDWSQDGFVDIQLILGEHLVYTGRGIRRVIHFYVPDRIDHVSEDFAKFIMNCLIIYSNDGYDYARQKLIFTKIKFNGYFIVKYYEESGYSYERFSIEYLDFDSKNDIVYFHTINNSLQDISFQIKINDNGYITSDITEFILLM